MKQDYSVKDILSAVDDILKVKSIQKPAKKIINEIYVKKGSIAIDGISLTVVDIKKTLVSVSLIPHTIEILNTVYRQGAISKIQKEIKLKKSAK